VGRGGGVIEPGEAHRGLTTMLIGRGAIQGMMPRGRRGEASWATLADGRRWW